ncbi:MAG TPA: hypothetical protein VGJ63_19710 [Micromonosporaceae bacterium]|jgi:hypothetical protein
MATEAVSPNPLGFTSTEPGAAPLATARRHRAELLQAIQSFERALAVPAGNPAWRDRVAARLGSLRAAFAEHVVVTEGADGLYAEVLGHAPRLSRAVHILIREHAALATAMDALQRQISIGRPRIEEVRGWASDLLRELSRHRQRGADLVYEAYATDIGGET